AVRRFFEQSRLCRAACERDATAAPREARVRDDDVVEQRARHPLRQVGESEERAGRPPPRNSPAPPLDELEEPVSRIEPKLHPSMVSERMFVCKRKRKAATRAASFLCFVSSRAGPSRP